MIDDFRPADSFTDRHGLFVALVGGPNSGKTFSALRLARGIAGPTGKIAVVDTEGGRTIHLKKDFAFNVKLLDPPHRPEHYSQTAERAEAAGYDVLVIDSFTAEWRGVGGVLDWVDEELDRMAGPNDHAKRERLKSAARIRPKMAHKLMVFSLLQRRIPIIFSVRGEDSFDPQTKKPFFNSLVAPGFLFEVTVSFRLAPDRKGIIDLSDKTSFKMEGVHQEIFHHGDQLSEDHGAALARWARGEDVTAGASAALIREAEEAVDRGTDAYVAFWKRIGKDGQRALLPDHEDRKRRAAMAPMPAVSNDDDGFPADLSGSRREA